MAALSKILTGMIGDMVDFVYPRHCHVCGTPLAPHEEFVCTLCVEHLPRTRYHVLDFNPMEQRFAGLFPFERATGHFFYSRGSALSQLIQDMKYRQFPGLARRLGRVVGEELYATAFFDGMEMIVPVPIHFMKKARRGYNQTEHLAAGITAATGIPTCCLLRACRPHKTQTSLTLAERRNNTSGIFRLRNPEKLDGRGVVLLDDVCTTGSTLTSAAEAILQEAPGCRLSLLTLGVTF